MAPPPLYPSRNHDLGPQLDGNTTFYSAYSREDLKLARVDRRLNSALRSYTHILKQLTALRAQKPPQTEPQATSIDPEATAVAPAQEAAEQLNPNSALFLISEIADNTPGETPAPPTPATHNPAPPEYDIRPIAA